MRVTDGSSTYWVCGSCACGCIAQLSSEKNAESAMMSFVRSAIHATRTKFKRSAGNYTNPYAHYVFVAGPERPNTGDRGYWSDYGTSFAAYIQEHKLGNVVTLPPVRNAKWHPGTTCQVWLWQPDKEALVKWFEAKMAAGVEIPKMRPDNIGQYTVCPRCGDYKRSHKDWSCPDGCGKWPED